MYPRIHENFKNSKARVQLYWLLYKKRLYLQSDVNSGPCEASMMKLSCRNSERLQAANYIHKKAPS